MDFSSLPEDQQQQLQKLQQLFQEHRQQQQQEQQQQQQIQDYASQAYDPTQVQAYDQSYYGYYQYQQDPSQSQQYSQHQEQQHQHQQQQQHYAYYHTDYANAYQQQPQQHEQPQIQPLSQPESAPIHQSGESQPQIADSGASVAAPVGHQQQQQNAYHPQQGGLVVGGEQANPGYPVPPGLNPAAAAAVAALSQLTQFAGTMEAAEKAMAMVGMQARGRGYGQMMGPGPGPGPGMGAFMGHGPMHRGPAPFHAPVDQSLYRGGGRRGGRFRGNSQGNFGNRPPRSGGTGPPSHWRGRGRGRGGPRHFPPNGASSSSHPKPSAHEKAEGEEEAAHTADNHEEPEAIQTSALKQGSTAPNKRPPQAAWCELCRVDCTSLEILEQHKNGKKHKKNLQKIEELQSTCKAVSEIQYEQTSVAESNPEVNLHTEIVQEGEDKKQTLPENLTTEPGDNENKVETEQQNDEAEQPGIPVAEQSNVQGRKPWMNHFDDQRRGMKRKMRGGRGGKRMKIDAQRRPMEPPKPKVVIPLICDLCNVKCDTQEVFDRHLAGKKHISKLKRFEGHQAMYGPMGLQALYPPNPIAQSLFVPQDPQQAFYGPQGSYPPPGSYMPPQAHHSTLSAAGTGSEFQQNPNHQVSGASYDFDGQKAIDKSSIDMLYDQLQSGVFLNQKRKKYWVERKTNSNCFMLYARDLSITWAQDNRYWHWPYLNETSNESIDVAELLNVCWLDIHGKFEIANLLHGVAYEVVFVVMLKDPSYGWEVPVNLRLITPDGTTQQHQENLMQKPRGQWIEIPAGEFRMSPEKIEDIQFSLYEYNGGQWKRGLVIKGVAIQPKK